MLTIEEFQEVMKSNDVGESAIRHARLALTYLNEYKPIEEVELMDVVRFINHMKEVRGFKPSTVDLYKRYIKYYFSRNNREDISDNISTKFKPEPISPENVLDVDDINFLLENVDSVMYRAIITFLYETGARISEAMKMKYPFDVGKEKAVGFDLTIRGTKKGKIRKMYLMESKAYMREWLMVRNTDSPYLFPLSPKAVGTWLRNLRENLNFQKPINPHAFRHGCATRLVRQGKQERMIREQLGWSANSKMIERYVHLAKTDLQTYQLMQAGELSPDNASMVELTQPTETAMDMLSKQEQEIMGLKEAVIALMNEKAERQAQLEAQIMRNPDEFDAEDIRPDVMPTTQKGVKEIKEEGKNFKGKMKKAIEEEAKKLKELPPTPTQ